MNEPTLWQLSEALTKVEETGTQEAAIELMKLRNRKTSWDLPEEIELYFAINTHINEVMPTAYGGVYEKSRATGELLPSLSSIEGRHYAE